MNIPSPVNITFIGSFSGSTVHITWASQTEHVDGYNIERKLPADTSYVLVGQVDGTTTSFDDSGLTPNTTYDYRIIAYNKCGYSNPTDAIATTDCTGATAPFSITPVAVSDTEIDITWSCTTVGATYIVQASNNGISYTTVGTTGVDVKHFAHTVGVSTCWYYKIACVICSTTVFSAPTTTQVCSGCTTPGVPSNVVVTTLSESYLQVDWTASSPIPATYTIERFNDLTSVWDVAGSVSGSLTTFTDTGLDAGVQYCYRIIAVSPCGSSVPSSQGCGTTLPLPQCGTPEQTFNWQVDRVGEPAIFPSTPTPSVYLRESPAGEIDVSNPAITGVQFAPNSTLDDILIMVKDTDPDVTMTYDAASSASGRGDVTFHLPHNCVLFTDTFGYYINGILLDNSSNIYLYNTTQKTFKIEADLLTQTFAAGRPPGSPTNTGTGHASDFGAGWLVKNFADGIDIGTLNSRGFIRTDSHGKQIFGFKFWHVVCGIGNVTISGLTCTTSTSSTSSSTSPCPVTCDNCCTTYTLTVSGSTSVNGTYTLSNDGICSWSSPTVGTYAAITCSGNLWKLQITSSTCTFYFTAARTAMCPPTSGWTFSSQTGSCTIPSVVLSESNCPSSVMSIVYQWNDLRPDLDIKVGFNSGFVGANCGSVPAFATYSGNNTSAGGSETVTLDLGASAAADVWDTSVTIPVYACWNLANNPSSLNAPWSFSVDVTWNNVTETCTVWSTQLNNNTCCSHQIGTIIANIDGSFTFTCAPDCSIDRCGGTKNFRKSGSSPCKLRLKTETVTGTHSKAKKCYRLYVYQNAVHNGSTYDLSGADLTVVRTEGRPSYNAYNGPFHETRRPWHNLSSSSTGASVGKLLDYEPYWFQYCGNQAQLDGIGGWNVITDSTQNWFTPSAGNLTSIYSCLAGSLGSQMPAAGVKHTLILYLQFTRHSATVTNSDVELLTAHIKCPSLELAPANICFPCTTFPTNALVTFENVFPCSCFVINTSSGTSGRIVSMSLTGMYYIPLSSSTGSSAIYFLNNVGSVTFEEFSQPNCGGSVTRSVTTAFNVTVEVRQVSSYWERVIKVSPMTQPNCQVSTTDNNIFYGFDNTADCLNGQFTLENEDLNVRCNCGDALSRGGIAILTLPCSGSGQGSIGGGLISIGSGSTNHGSSDSAGGDITTNLVRQYLFDDDTGVQTSPGATYTSSAVVKDSKSGINGTVSGTVIREYGVVGTYGVLLNPLDTSNTGRINASSSGLPTGANARTVAFWVKTTSGANFFDAISYGDHTSGHFFAVGIQGGKVTLNTSGSTGSWVIQGNTVINNDDWWHHVVVVVAAFTVLIYVDGALDTSASVTLNTTSTVGNDTGLWIGDSANTQYQLYDDVRIYSRALGASDVTSLYWNR